MFGNLVTLIFTKDKVRENLVRRLVESTKNWFFRDRNGELLKFYDEIFRSLFDLLNFALQKQSEIEIKNIFIEMISQLLLFYTHYPFKNSDFSINQSDVKEEYIESQGVGLLQ